MNEEETDQIEFYLNAWNEFKDVAEGITDWERSFMADQVKRYEEYGSRTRFSDKQMDVIERVYAKLPIWTGVWFFS